MLWKWLRSWPVIALAGATVAVAVVHAVVDRLTREPQNYSRIEDGLWLGGYVKAPPPGTQAVLNLCEAEDGYQAAAHRWEPIDDAEPAPDLAWLRQQVAFIDAERAAGHVVFVHCRNGVSRSAMVLAAYLMRRDGRSRDETLDFLRSQRSVVRPNPAFMQLLSEWEQSLKG